MTHPTTDETLDFTSGETELTLLADDFSEATGRLSIAWYGKDDYHLHNAQPHLGFVKYKPLLRVSRSNQAYLVSLVKVVVKAILRSSLRKKDLPGGDRNSF